MIGGDERQKGGQRERVKGGHLFFAAVTTAYILIAIQLEERDLVTYYGDAYRQYQQQVRMLLPIPRKSQGPSKEP